MTGSEPRHQIDILRPPTHEPLQIAVGRLTPGAQDEPRGPSMHTSHVSDQIAQLPVGTGWHRRAGIGRRGNFGQTFAV